LTPVSYVAIKPCTPKVERVDNLPAKDR